MLQRPIAFKQRLYHPGALPLRRSARTATIFYHPTIFSHSGKYVCDPAKRNAYKSSAGCALSSRARIFPLVVLLTVRSSGTSLSWLGKNGMESWTGWSGGRRGRWSRFELFRVCVSATMIAVLEDGSYHTRWVFCRVVGRFFFRLDVLIRGFCWD